MEQLLFDAINLGRVETINTLLSRGANVDALNEEGITLLHKAVVKKNKEIVKLLIDAGADVNLKNSDDETPLFVAIGGITGKNSFKIPSSSSKTIIKILIDAGADVNIPSEGRTALHLAAMEGNLEIVTLLVNHGANVNEINYCILHEEYTSLHHAIEYIHVLEVLLRSGADVNARTKQNETPIHLLAKTYLVNTSYYCKIIELLIRYGADIHALKWNEESPINLAISYKNTCAVEAFILNGAYVNAIYMPLDEGGQPNGNTLLHQACFIGDSLTVKVLLKYGADPNALNNDNETPLLRAINQFEYDKNWDQIVDILKNLFKLNVNVNVISTDRLNVLNSPLHDEEGSDEVWQTIIKHLAKLRAKDQFIHADILTTISEKPNFEDYFSRCNQEIVICKSIQLHPESWVTFFNLLMDNEEKLIQYVGNVNLVLTDFKKNNICKKFPIYGQTIYQKFKKAVRRRLIWDQARTKLSNLLPAGIDSTHRIVIKILSYLDIKDLKKFSNEGFK